MSRSPAVRITSRLLQAAGIVLAVAGAGLFWNNPPSTTGPAAAPGYSINIEKRLTGWEDPNFRRGPSETDHQFVSRMTRTVFGRIYHCEMESKPRLIEWIVAEVQSDTFRQVGILTPGALQCGFCNQRSYVLAKALNDSGIEAELFVLNGHVVALTYFDGKAWIADADFGVGPVEYPTSWKDVESRYRQITNGNREWTAALERAYETTLDDVPYFRSMEWMNDVEIQQRQLIKFIESFRWFAAMLGLALWFAGYRMRRSKSVGFADSALRPFVR